MKPNPRDKNTMPYEMVDFVRQKTQLQAIERVGGTVDLLKRLVAGGFPVIVEKGFEVSGEGWMGHYALINGYEDAKNRFITQDAYAQPEEAKYLAVPYTDLAVNWRAFNYVYVVIYPTTRENEVFSILGDMANEAASYQAAAERASVEISALTGRDQYFAWYNRGSSLVYLDDYAGAAKAYDEAFKIYPTIPEKKRPWRMVWYQTGPYFAYFYTGRYKDVLSLATTTLSTMSEKAIEESWVWRARARVALGDTQGAIDDLREALKYHPGWAPAVQEMQNLGVAP
jgi:tetratricopeptide (TPR) repeat protein